MVNTRLNMQGINKQQPYLAKYFARLGVPMNNPPNQRPKADNTLQNALSNYSFHLNNRKNITQQRPTLR